MGSEESFPLFLVLPAVAALGGAGCWCCHFPTPFLDTRKPPYLMVMGVVVFERIAASSRRLYILICQLSTLNVGGDVFELVGCSVSSLSRVDVSPACPGVEVINCVFVPHFLELCDDDAPVLPWFFFADHVAQAHGCYQPVDAFNVRVHQVLEVIRPIELCTVVRVPADPPSHTYTVFVHDGGGLDFLNGVAHHFVEFDTQIVIEV